MLCKIWKNKTMVAILCLGVVSFAYGMVSFLVSQSEGSHYYNTLMGMFAGFGAGIIAVAIVRFLHSKALSPEKKERLEIEKSDERNIAISRAAGNVGFCAGVSVLAILSFVFMALEYGVPSFVCIGGIYVIVVAYLIAHKVYEKRF